MASSVRGWPGISFPKLLLTLLDSRINGRSSPRCCCSNCFFYNRVRNKLLTKFLCGTSIFKKFTWGSPHLAAVWSYWRQFHHTTKFSQKGEFTAKTLSFIHNYIRKITVKQSVLTSRDNVIYYFPTNFSSTRIKHVSKVSAPTCLALFTVPFATVSTSTFK